MLKEYTLNLLNLFFPNLCHACNKLLVKGEETICLFCETKLPYTNFHKQSSENALTQKFIGRLNIEHATSLLFFEKGSHVQNLMQALKYRNKEEVGFYLGNLYGKILKETKHPLSEYDLILPLPLHPKKQQQRGYNQCDSIAKGLSESSSIEWDKSILKRAIYNVTQTGKNRVERWKNVDGIFKIIDPKSLINKRIILLDDIITTGATLEAAGREINQIENTELSIITLAYAF